MRLITAAEGCVPGWWDHRWEMQGVREVRLERPRGFGDRGPYFQATKSTFQPKDKGYHEGFYTE